MECKWIRSRDSNLNSGIGKGWETVFLALACNTDTTPTQPHRNSNTHRTNNNTTNVVIQQNNRKLLMMVILMSATCWAHKKWNKIASDIKLVFILQLPFHLSMCQNAWYMLPFKRRSPLYICNTKLTFRDEHEPRSVQIIRMEKTRSIQKSFVALAPVELY